MQHVDLSMFYLVYTAFGLLCNCYCNIGCRRTEAQKPGSVVGEVAEVLRVSDVGY